MRPHRAELLSLAGLTLVLAVLLGFAGVGRGGATLAQSRPVSADSSAVVVLMENRTQVPVQVFFKSDSAGYARLGICAPVERCLFVVPSDRLGVLDKFRIAGLARGEDSPNDSPVYQRVPGKVNITVYTVAPAPDAPALGRPSEAGS